jgi:hypothetical protein
MPAFEGQRPPFEPGNQVSVGNRGGMSHGAYSSALSSSPRVLEIADEQRAVAPWLRPEHELALRLLGLAVARLERSSTVTLAPPEEGDDVEEWATRVKATTTLSRDERGWLAQATRLAHELGLTPAGQAAIEERERTVIFVAEAQELFTALFTAAAAFVPAEVRAAFLEAVDQAAASVPISRPALEAGQPIVDTEAGGSIDGA